MKKTIAFVLTLLMCLSLLACGAPQEVEEEAPQAVVPVFVTIASEGELVAWLEVQVPDEDADGSVTIAQTLEAAHDLAYEGGAPAGFASEETEYGLSLVRLWGVENGGSYGYCVNNASALSLKDSVVAGDYVAAYSYKDLSTWSDMYCWFESTNAQGTAGEALTLSLNGAGYDESWNPVTLPVAGAELTVNGEGSGVLTGEDGCAELLLSEAGEYIISARSDSAVLVPPLCIVTVK